MGGRLITFEGGEGAGKTSQIRLLADYLEQLPQEVVVTREPGGSPRAETIRAALLGGKAKAFGPLAETLMFCAARRDHLDRLIRPALERGAVVLCDRFIDSTRAYQGALGSVPAATIRALERIVAGPTRPDLTIILDVPAEVGLARAQARRLEGRGPVDRFEAEDHAFHDRLRRAFQDIAAAEPDRCVLVDGGRPVEAVAAEIRRHVADRLNLQRERQDGQDSVVGA